MHELGKARRWEKNMQALSKEVKKNVRKDHRAYADKIESEAEEAANQGNIKVVFNAIRRLTKNA